MSYSAKAIANLLIDIAKANGSVLDQMKLQKLVYITHGWHLAITGNPLITDEIEAWQYGPVIPVLYEEFKNCGRDPITDYASDLCIDESNLNFRFVTPKIDANDTTTSALAAKIWAKYGALSGPQLSNLTHLPDTPWDKVYRTSPRSVIRDELIRDHFVELAQNRDG